MPRSVLQLWLYISEFVTLYLLRRICFIEGNVYDTLFVHVFIKLIATSSCIFNTDGCKNVSYSYLYTSS
jgi:hypothetical protein